MGSPRPLFRRLPPSLVLCKWGREVGRVREGGKGEGEGRSSGGVAIDGRGRGGGEMGLKRLAEHLCPGVESEGGKSGKHGVP